MRRLPAFALALGAFFLADASPAAAGVEGRWLTEKKNGIVEIFGCAAEQLCGRLAWFRLDPGDENPRGLDLNNPDSRQRGRPLCGLVVISRFKPAGTGIWEDGMLYDPRSGNTYNGTITLQADGNLRLRGYIGISLLGASETWTRYNQAPPPCPGR